MEINRHKRIYKEKIEFEDIKNSAYKRHTLRTVIGIMSLFLLFSVGQGLASSFEIDTDRPGMDYRTVDLQYGNTTTCDDICKNDPNCKAWTWVSPGIQGPNAYCWLKSAVPEPVSNSCCVSGVISEDSAVSVIPTTAPTENIPTAAPTENTPTTAPTDNKPTTAPTENAPTTVPTDNTPTMAPTENTPTMAPTENTPTTVPTDNTPTTAPTNVAQTTAPADVVENALPADINTVSARNKLVTVPLDVLQNMVPASFEMDENIGINLPGNDYKPSELTDSEPIPQSCEDICKGDPNCKAWTYVKPGIQSEKAMCLLKSNISRAAKDDCCVSGIIKPIVAKIDADSFLLETATPSDRIQKMQQFDKSWRTLEKANIGDFNKKLIANQENVRNTQVKLFEEDSRKLNVRENVDVNNDVIDISSRAKIGKANEQGIMSNIDPSILVKPINISKVETLTTSPSLQKDKDSIFEGNYLLIYGEDFGQCTVKCGVQLDYTLSGNNYEFATVFPTFKKDLVSYQNDWNRSWFDNFIIVRIPMLPLSYRDDIRSANITVWRDGEPGVPGVSKKYPVSLKKVGPGINYYNAAPMWSEDFISSEGEIWIYGNGFGREPGELYLDLSYHPDISELSPYLPDNKLYLTIPVGGWSDNLIHAYIPKVGNKIINYGVGTAMMHIKDKESNRDTFTSAKFGPKMTVKVTSGKDFLELGSGDKEDSAEEGSNVLVVTHVTGGCDWNIGPFHLSSGNNGKDWFFNNKPLPKNVKLISSDIRAVNPDDTSKTVEIIIKEVLSWGSIMLDGGSGFIRKFGEYMFSVVASALDSGYGRYTTNLYKTPTKDDPSIGINWENSCNGPYENVPNKYVGTFVLYGPEGLI